MFYTYILYSEKSGAFYIGQTNNLVDRLERHNSGRNKFTRSHGYKTLRLWRDCSANKFQPINSYNLKFDY
ncbi:MAG: GIY-YIG nuclease family protein [Salinivirgaceae bacterium]